MYVVQNFKCFMFYRDASFGTCMYNLNILDCLRGVHKVCHLKNEFLFFVLLTHPNKMTFNSTLR